MEDTEKIALYEKYITESAKKSKLLENLSTGQADKLLMLAMQYPKDSLIPFFKPFLSKASPKVKKEFEALLKG